jgi:MFS family permease
VVRIGLVCEMLGLAAVALAISEPPSFAAILPGTLLFGVGVGFGASQLTNVVLSDVDEDKMGVASGTNATVRQVGLAIGIATFASLLEINSIADGARPALLFAASVVTVGTLLSLLIPRVGNLDAVRGQRVATTVPVTSPNPSDRP